jgi:hypothetical protein
MVCCPSGAGSFFPGLSRRWSAALPRVGRVSVCLKAYPDTKPFKRQRQRTGVSVPHEQGVKNGDAGLCGSNPFDELRAGSGLLSVAPSGLGPLSCAYPRLAPWAAFLRRFSAGFYIHGHLIAALKRRSSTVVSGFGVPFDYLRAGSEGIP